MDLKKALEYCYKHKNEYVRDMFDCGEDGVRQFDCLIELLESETIQPNELADYGMDY